MIYSSIIQNKNENQQSYNSAILKKNNQPCLAMQYLQTAFGLLLLLCFTGQ